MTKNEIADYELFAMSGEKMIHDELDVGIINGMLSINGPYRNAMMVKGLFAPPFVSSDFCLEVRLFGENVRSAKHKWYPSEIQRSGEINGVKVESNLVLAGGKRAFIMEVNLSNTSGKKLNIPLQIGVNGTLDYNRVWNFFRQYSSTAVKSEKHTNGLLLHNNHGSIVVDTTIPGLSYCPYSKILEGNIAIAAKGKASFFITAAIGYNDHTSMDATLSKWTELGYSSLSSATAEKDAAELIASPVDSIEEGRKHFAARVNDLLNKMPKFHSSSEPLNKWYYRSLVHLLLNQWNDVPEFFLNPYFSTGSLNGGCCCSYLWDFGANWKIWGLYHPEAAKNHIKAFLNIDLKNHFAFLPMDNSPFGPWYYINQEKIIFCIYYYVLHTGDVKFLREKFNGRTIIEHVIEQALICDDLDKEAVLVDYGTGNHHLELLQEYRYDNVMPDMNLRRASYYRATDILIKLAKYKSKIDFVKRARAICKLVSDELYDPQAKWFQWRDADGHLTNRYTIQMFKTFGFPQGWTLTREQHHALLSHLNEKEFLGEYGMHSMAKHDPAYDQADIDNGGGGSCIFFAPEIAEKLYLDGEKQVAEDIIKRLLWWGERMPFWGDSIVANYIDYRKNTPLQNAIGGAAASSTVIFGIFGVQVNDEFEIIINPNPPEFAQDMELKGLHLANRVLDITVKGSNYQVKSEDGKIIRSVVGKAVKLAGEIK